MNDRAELSVKVFRQDVPCTVEVTMALITASAFVDPAFCFFAVPARRAFLRRIMFFSFDYFDAIDFRFVFDIVIDFPKAPVG